jgi:hypothetical protein
LEADLLDAVGIGPRTCRLKWHQKAAPDFAPRLCGFVIRCESSDFSHCPMALQVFRWSSNLRPPPCRPLPLRRESGGSNGQSLTAQEAGLVGRWDNYKLGRRQKVPLYIAEIGVYEAPLRYALNVFCGRDVPLHEARMALAMRFSEPARLQSGPAPVPATPRPSLRQS